MVTVLPFFYLLGFCLWDTWDLGSLTRVWTCISCTGRRVLTSGPWGKSLAFLFLHLILLAFPQTNECASAAWLWTSTCSHSAVPCSTSPNATVQEGHSPLASQHCNCRPRQYVVEAHFYPAAYVSGLKWKNVVRVLIQMSRVPELSQQHLCHLLFDFVLSCPRATLITAASEHLSAALFPPEWKPREDRGLSALNMATPSAPGTVLGTKKESLSTGF